MHKKYKFFILTVILSICSISYELLLANTLSQITGNYIQYQTLSIGIFILGLGIGSFISDFIETDSEKNIKIIEFLIAIVGFFSIFIIYSIAFNYKFNEFFLLLKNDSKSIYLLNYLKIFFFISTEFIILLLGTLSGFEIPLIMRILKKEENKVLSLNYIGTLFGTLFFTFILNKFLNNVQISLILSLLNLIALIIIQEKIISKIITGILIIILTIINLYFFHSIEQKYYTFYYSLSNLNTNDNLDTAINKANNMKPITRIKTLYQNIDIVENEHNLTLYMDSNFQFSSETEKFYHQAFAHIPIILTNYIPKNILIIGAGDGLLLKELIKYKEIEKIHQIELDPEIVSLSKNHSKIAKLNNKSFNDPRLKLELGDGFSYIKNTNETYDAIFIDLPYPKTHDLAKIYSIEFYSFILKRLSNNNSFFVLDLPIIDSNDIQNDPKLDNFAQYNNVLFSTLYYAGCNQLFPYKISSENFMICKKNGLIINNDKKFNLNFLNEEVKSEFNSIFNLKYNYIINEKFINSVFKPKSL